jgi:hypothetical protein
MVKIYPGGSKWFDESTGKYRPGTPKHILDGQKGLERQKPVPKKPVPRGPVSRKPKPPGMVSPVPRGPVSRKPKPPGMVSPVPVPKSPRMFPNPGLPKNKWGGGSAGSIQRQKKVNKVFKKY